MQLRYTNGWRGKSREKVYRNLHLRVMMKSSTGKGPPFSQRVAFVQRVFQSNGSFPGGLDERRTDVGSRPAGQGDFLGQ